MALKRNESTQFGFDVPDAYQRVENITLRKTSMQFQVCVYADLAKNAFNHKTYACEYNINGSNPISQAYNYLKTLEEFSNAVDC